MNFRTDTVLNKSAVNALAVVGFVALIAGGIWLAIYSTRFVPAVVNGAETASIGLVDAVSTAASRVGTAAVYLGSFFTPSPSGLSVVPTASTTIPFGEPTATTSSSGTKGTSFVPVPVSSGHETNAVYPIGGTASTTPILQGLPDLVTTIDAVGYLATTSANSFVASSTVPAGSRPAVKFSIKNKGTNMAGSWRFSASIPTVTGYVYQSQLQQPLYPGDRIDYVLGFDQAVQGTGKTITIIANPDRVVPESDFSNDSATAKVTILGS